MVATSLFGVGLVGTVFHTAVIVGAVARGKETDRFNIAGVLAYSLLPALFFLGAATAHYIGMP